MAVAGGDEDWAGPLAALFTPLRMPYLTRGTSPLIPMTKAYLVLKSKPKNSAWFYMLSKSEPIVTASRKPSQPLSNLLTGSFVALSLVRAASEPLSMMSSSLCRFMSVNVYVCVRTRICGVCVCACVCVRTHTHQCLPDLLSQPGMLSPTGPVLGPWSRRDPALSFPGTPGVPEPVARGALTVGRAGGRAQDPAAVPSSVYPAKLQAGLQYPESREWSKIAAELTHSVEHDGCLRARPPV
ncbi:uncharacterized protein LOC125096866 [Lutra lutra]|uniref:uncharacterized protein LOC125096866 n=1 Tax=Lutra lutra TaxID=9657 RepID=UPI001FCFD7A1|nr:uncharacterized protein LOC125096866 [Lutra lutra]